MKTLIRSLAAAALGLAALTSTAVADWRTEYPKITFGVTSGENAKDSRARWTPFVAYLEEQLGIEVELRQASDYAGIIEAMGAGRVEMAWYGGAGYAAAWDVMKGNIEPIAMDVSAKGKMGYHSVLVVKGDSDVADMEGLAGKSLAFADPNSTSGFMIPNYWLRKLGKIGGESEFFKSTGFSGSHENGILAVMNGTYDVAATWTYDEEDGNISRMIRKGMINEGDVKVIWTSPLIPNSPFTVLKSLPEDMKADLKAAMTEMNTRDPERFEQVSQGEFQRFAEATHDMYVYAIELREEQKKQR